MPFALVGGENFHYEIAGSGPPLLLVSGLGGAGSYWDANMPALTRHFTIIRYDHRGTGNSVRTEGAYSVEAMADDLAGLLDAIGQQHVLFLGHSTGGAIGQVLAARYPQRIARLVLYASWATVCPQMALCFDVRLRLLSAYGPEAYHRSSPLFLYPPRYICNEGAQLQTGLDQAVRHSTTASILRERALAVISFDGRPYLPHITCPTLVLVAQDDILTPPASSEELAKNIAAARLQVLPYGGHAVSISASESFEEAVIEFLSQEK